MPKYAAYGAKLQYDADTTPTDLAYIRDLGGPTFSSDTVDVTTHDSPNGLREFIVSLRSGGEISLDLVFDPANAGHVKLTTEWQAATSDTYRIVMTDSGATEWEFDAFVTGFDMSQPADGELSASVTLTITGDINFSPA